MQFHTTTLPGICLVEPDVFSDPRGFFTETFQHDRYARAGISGPFVQDNHSRSRRHVLRGLHYQLQQPQAKLVHVIRGAVYDVAVDIRRGSPHFGQWYGAELSDLDHRQIYVPAGFAHGFWVLSAEADVIYKCDAYYAPGDEYGVLWSDPDLGIEWPLTDPLLSPKDAQYPRLADIPLEQLPAYRPPVTT